MLTFNLNIENLLNANITNAGTTTSASMDISDVKGNVWVNVDNRASGTGATGVVLQHSEDDSTWSTVPSSAVFDEDADNNSFSDLDTSASEETRILNRQQLKRYLRVNFDGSTFDMNVAVVAAAQDQTTGI